MLKIMDDLWTQVESKIMELASPGIRPGLARLARLLALLDNPQRKFPSVLVVGTNGKGSTCSSMFSCLKAGGYKVGLYTSPHLESPAERSRIGDELADPLRWLGMLERIEELITSDSRLLADRPSYFELVTALAFMDFADARVDVAVVEAGMGGRLDATNMLGDVRCVVCTPIGMDHAEFLGHSLYSIAREKMAVIRPHRPTVFAGGDEELETLFIRRCTDVSAVPLVHSKECRVEMTDISLSGVEFLRVRNGETRSFSFSLTGVHQPANASLALMALESIDDQFPLSEDHIRSGLRDVRWPGRMEWISLEDGRGIVLDGAHNPHGAKALADSLEALGFAGKCSLVFAAMGDKDISGILEGLRGVARRFFFTQVPGSERSAKAERLFNEAVHMGLPLGGFSDDPVVALEMATEDSPMTVVCGSLFLVGYVRNRLKRKP
ncbi:folylpolyglutamate synthase/dihydrofolate synthase [Thermanaerovibrio velox DSM 12556]|uniref:tetrahydrofolate synthase n=2 Tax=Thermanaerovibrio TaxID=81461 RepID=H0URY8_9BACT|nr:folylpolyglutamate synthase/dihydrofolate synthase [Thermanaerovibrio velox DSM 12556]